MVNNLQCALIQPNQRSEIIFSLAHYRSNPIRVLFATQQQKKYFDDVIINTHYKNIYFSTFRQYIESTQIKKQIVIIADIPIQFQLLTNIHKKIQNDKNQGILILLKLNKKYLNMIHKKLGINISIMQYSHSKFVGINDKLREFVQQSYDLNRAGFYAYGSYINYFRKNLLQKIFRTDQINVDLLARSFGFTTPPRVKEGKFLTQKARKQKISQKIKEKKIKQSKKTEQVKVNQPVSEQKTKKIKKINKVNKVK